LRICPTRTIITTITTQISSLKNQLLETQDQLRVERELRVEKENLLATITLLAIMDNRELHGRFLGNLAALGLEEVLDLVLCTFIASSPHHEGQLESSQDLGTAIYKAATHDKVKCLTILLLHASSSIPLAVCDGLSALIRACNKGHVDSAQLLLQYKPEEQVSTMDEKGGTALMHAVRNGYVECARLLLQHKPEEQVAAQDNNGMTALMYAANEGHQACIHALMAHNPTAQLSTVAPAYDLCSLSLAACHGFPDCLSALLSYGPPPPQRLDNALAKTASRVRYEPREEARNQERKRCLQILLSKGAKSIAPATLAVLWPIFQDSAEQATVPFYANEAGVGRALEVESRKRMREGGPAEDDEAGPS
jgi:ankyrin repeat protein